MEDEQTKMIHARHCRIFSGAVFLALALTVLPGILQSQESELLVSPGKLSKAHDEFSGLNNCPKCHETGKKSVDGKCLACHEELAARIGTGRGFHRDKKTGCPTCHPDHQGPDFALIDWNPREFDHTKSGYVLKGKHAAVMDCGKCHNARNSPTGKTEGTYLIRSSRCGSCHEDVHKGQFSKDCDACHAIEVPLKEITFDHAAAAYPLKGGHRNVACEKCHPQKKWKGLSYASCQDCHRDPHNPSLGKTCTKCHTEVSWKLTSFNHDQSKYPLRGKHDGLRCEQCHRSGKLEKIPFAFCRDCHGKDPHQGQFQDDCGRCHNVSGFKPATVDHGNSQYPLTGKHAVVPCAKCHFTGKENAPVIYKPLKTGCGDCHKDIHIGQFAKSCEACHSTRGFDGKTLAFDHQKDSSYKLEGAHVPLKCEACHKKENAVFPDGAGEAVRYRPLSAECVSCHPAIHGSQMVPDCRKCHDVTRFKPAPGFGHEKTRFPLKGFHDSVACDKCHPLVKLSLSGRTFDSPRYQPTALKCADCHGRSDHSRTAYALTGRHASLECERCHNAKTPHLKRLRARPGGSFACKDCHATRHPGKQENCEVCHTTKGWAVDVF